MASQIEALRCAHCPLRGRPKHCAGQGNLRDVLCRQVDPGSADYRPGRVRLILTAAGYPEEAAQLARTGALRGAGPPAVAAAGGTRPQPPASELEVLAIVGRCDFGRVPACNCTGHVYCIDGGRHPREKVPVAECLRCLDAQQQAHAQATATAAT